MYNYIGVMFILFKYLNYLIENSYFFSLKKTELESVEMNNKKSCSYSQLGP